jgi:hypothetical protein
MLCHIFYSGRGLLKDLIKKYPGINCIPGFIVGGDQFFFVKMDGAFHPIIGAIFPGNYNAWF